MPPEINKFSDIKLRDYHKMEHCSGSDPMYKYKYKGPPSNKLFKNYANNLKKMIIRVNNISGGARTSSDKNDRERLPTVKLTKQQY